MTAFDENATPARLESPDFDHADSHAWSVRNSFAGLPIDRLAERRGDEEWLRARARDPASVVVVGWRNRQLLQQREALHPVTFSAAALDSLGTVAEPPVLLGQVDGRTWFALDLPAQDETIPARFSAHGEFLDLRAVGPALAERDGALLAFARGITYWHRRHRYCGDCGYRTEVRQAGYLRVCTNSACGAKQFPRVDPAVIVLVGSGELCLLGRQPTWRERLYSTIAGFVEPGESLEDAVVREVREETGVRLRTVCYHSSQPWPFPSSLMLGYTAEAANRRIECGDDELEHARWFSRLQIEEGLRDGSLQLPSRISIALRLIEDWFDAGHPGRLRRLLGSL